MGSKLSSPNPSPPDTSGLTTTKFIVGMTCSGCSGAVTRILKKLPGVESVETSVADKTVFVKSRGVESEVMLESLLKWSESSGKNVEMPETQ
ncbi:hypothetical protein TrST_g8772 [Triparma strigata]|uniref:HMA domain-containing protein n=1 Tax=Triparma strigata TaxID=1606541 RepID=A0A9W7AR86_9STRA|nr:hypothetical protein TrST_g8772 [Triparma strigata]